MRDSDASPRNLILLCLASVGWAFSFGLGAPLASLWLRDGGATDTIIGLNTGIYYLGIAAAAGFVPGLMRRWGRACPVVGMVVSGLTVAWFPWAGSLTAEFGFRLVNGIAAALSLIPLETYVNRCSRPAQRARNFGFYAFAIAFGWALGNLVGLQMYASAARWAFVIGGIGAGLAALVVGLGLPWPAEPVSDARARTPLAFRRNFLSFGSAWSQGFLEGGMVAFMSLYLLFLGMSQDRVSWLTSGIMIGVILFQIPVAWLADRFGRTAILVGCYGATMISLAVLPTCTDSGWLTAWLFLVGACSGAFYPLGLALLGERVPAAGLARASAWYLAINCCGSLIGPVVTGAAMDWFGKPAMFPVGMAAVGATLALWLVIRPPNAAQDRNAEHPAGNLEARDAA